MIGVRAASVVDARAIAEVHVRSWHDGYAGLLPDALIRSQSVEARTRQWKAWLERGEPFLAFVAAEPANTGERIVAFTAAGPATDADVDGGEVHACYAVREVWGRGAGPGVLRAATLALASHDDVAVLWVLESNGRARRFYEREGWSADGARRARDRGGLATHDVRYRIDLRPWQH